MSLGVRMAETIARASKNSEKQECNTVIIYAIIQWDCSKGTKEYKDYYMSKEKALSVIATKYYEEYKYGDIDIEPIEVIR